MRFRRPSFRLRTLMALVALVAVGMGGYSEYHRLSRLSAAYRVRAQEHAAVETTLRALIAIRGPDAPVDISPGPGLRSKRFTARAVADLEASLARKYARAARFPWLPVEPDPPEPTRPYPPAAQ